MTTTFLRPELTGPNMSSTVSGFESKIQHSSDYPFHSQKDQCLSPTLPTQACCNCSFSGITQVESIWQPLRFYLQNLLSQVQNDVYLLGN